MALERNREDQPPGEDQLIAKMVELGTARTVPQAGRVRRGQHAKPLGCVRGTFTVREDLPAELRHGVFQMPGKTYDAIVRFSNSSDNLGPDAKGAARGIAIKLLNVEGERAVAVGTDRSQDFLAVNHPVFPFPGPAEYVGFFSVKAWPVVGEVASLVWLVVGHPHILRIVQAIRSKVIASPLEITYWSGSPYWLGPPNGGPATGQAVKYAVVPHASGTPIPSDLKQLPADYLGDALQRHLREREAVFDFKVQVQKDPKTMPIEDASIEWDETVSPPETVATLRIPAQDVNSPEGRELANQCEAMSFTPWNALANHRPMGGINRLRKAVYLASVKARTEAARTSAT